tara:strand:- start:506 stop:682 length:177 start_codon:yes stop_codon:yes gene_type:complete
MEISIISLVRHHEDVTVWANALAPDVGTQIWIKVEFERSDRELWTEARDRVLAVLDVA